MQIDAHDWIERISEIGSDGIVLTENEAVDKLGNPWLLITKAVGT